MKVGSILINQKENQWTCFKKEEEVSRKFKNEQSTREVVLIVFWDCCGLVYSELGPDTHKEKWNVTQDSYFDFNAIEECNMI